MLAIVVFFATRRPFLAVAVFAFVLWWMNAQTRRRPPTVRVDPSSVEPPDPSERDAAEATADPNADADDGVEVRCDVANDRLQRWVSLTTGRGYEVPPERGVAGAEPGMHGVVVVRDGKISVRAVASLDDGVR